MKKTSVNVVYTDLRRLQCKNCEVSGVYSGKTWGKFLVCYSAGAVCTVWSYLPHLHCLRQGHRREQGLWFRQLQFQVCQCIPFNISFCLQQIETRRGVTFALYLSEQPQNNSSGKGLWQDSAWRERERRGESCHPGLVTLPACLLANLTPSTCLWMTFIRSTKKRHVRETCCSTAGRKRRRPSTGSMAMGMTTSSCMLSGPSRVQSVEGQLEQNPKGHCAASFACLCFARLWHAILGTTIRDDAL